MRSEPFFLLALALGCSVPPLPDDVPPDAEALSLSGTPLYAPPLDAKTRAEREALLQKARDQFEQHPDDLDALIWYGRRTAYLGSYRAAVLIYSRGLEIHGDDAKLLRHRGHRYITLRLFDRAIADLERATELIAGRGDEIEPDGLPNAKNRPTSTLHSNIWYHLGLAYYLTLDYANAERCYDECLRFANNPDMEVATRYWLFLSSRRARDVDAAMRALEPVQANLDILENHAYLALLLAYQGQRTLDSVLKEARASNDATRIATVAYGAGVFHLLAGDTARARDLFEAALATRMWPAFGATAAEAELATSGLAAPP